MSTLQSIRGHREFHDVAGIPCSVQCPYSMSEYEASVAMVNAMTQQMSNVNSEGTGANGKGLNNYQEEILYHKCH